VYINLCIITTNNYTEKKSEFRTLPAKATISMEFKRVQCSYKSLVHFFHFLSLCIRLVNFVTMLTRISCRMNRSKSVKKCIVDNNIVKSTSLVFTWCELSCILLFLIGNLILLVTIFNFSIFINLGFSL